MRKIKNKISIVQYVVLFFSVTFLLVMIFLLVFIQVMTRKAEWETVKNDLRTQIVKSSKYIEESDGKIQFSEHFENDNKEYFFIILDKDGNYLCGQYPSGYDISRNLTFQDMDCVRMDGKSFYVMDRKTILSVRGVGTKGEYIIRGIIKKEDVPMIFRTIQRFSYGLILVTVVGLTGCIYILHRRLSKPLIQMCEAADQISEELDFSEKIEYDGYFYEVDTLLKAYNRLLTRMDMVVSRQEQFNSDISHELRTPIAVIRAQCQLSKEHAQKKQDLELLEAIEVIERQSDKMNHMVQQLLKLSRLEQNKMKLELEKVDLIAIVESVCEDEDYLSGEQYQFIYDLKPCVSWVDINLITVAIRNLVSNAVKYSSPSSEIRVSCGKEKESIFVSIQDFGCGIEKEDQKRIFESFYRSEEARNSEGIGLGLTLAMKIAKCHGGTIRVESEVGKGSIFTLVLP
ncbi:MAG: HAMP domain-containing sensor histidine kinase [Lachnospiraceae bacterium]|nr:HAMP domain-containing sensor histidine kinase [Lachnospiraceae bacterium]